MLRTIFLADDHQIVAQGLATLLKTLPDVQDVVVFEDGQKLYHHLEKQQPNIILLDIEMPIWNGMETLKKIKAVYAIPCIMLSMNDEKYIIQECLKLGADGFLPKDCSLDEFQEAIEMVTEGCIYLSPKIEKIIASKKTVANNIFELLAPLTQRELEILTEICEGLTCKEIAKKIFLSTRTVETHKKTIMFKFDAHTTGKLVALAIKHKFVK